MAPKPPNQDSGSRGIGMAVTNPPGPFPQEVHVCGKNVQPKTIAALGSGE